MPTPMRAIWPILATGIVTWAQHLDLTKATVVAPANLSAPEKKAVAMLVEEVEKQTQLRWTVSPAWPDSGPAIAVGTEVSLRPVAGARLGGAPAKSAGAEGYRLWTSGNDLCVAGNDARGVLFGVGRLLRTLRMERGSAIVPARLKIVSH